MGRIVRRVGVEHGPADGRGQLGGVDNARRGGHRPAGGVGQPHEQRQNDPVGHERGPAVGEEGRGQTGQRDEARDAADDDEDLQGDGEGQADGQQLAEAVAQVRRRAQAALNEDEVEHEQRQHPHQPQLLAEGGDDEVGVREGHEVGVPLAPPGSQQPARGHAEQPRHQLLGTAVLGAVDGGVHGVQPAADALLHVAEVGGREPGRRNEQGRADEQPAGPVGGHVQGDDEQSEQEQRAAQVALEDQDDDAHAPHDQQGAQVPGPGQVDAHDPAARQREVIAVGHEEGGEEDRQEHLGHLRRLEGHGAQADPDPGAVDALAQAGHEGQDEEGQAAPHGPAVPSAQQAVVAHQQHRAEQDDAHARPHRLLGGVVVRPLKDLVGHVQALDHGQAQAVEGHRRRQDHRIRPGGGAPHP